MSFFGSNLIGRRVRRIHPEAKERIGVILLVAHCPAFVDRPSGFEALIDWGDCFSTVSLDALRFAPEELPSPKPRPL